MSESDGRRVDHLWILEAQPTLLENGFSYVHTTYLHTTRYIPKRNFVRWCSNIRVLRKWREK